MTRPAKRSEKAPPWQAVPGAFWLRRMARRRFLRGMGAAGAGLLAAACAADEIAQAPAAYRTPTAFRALASPQSGAEDTAGAEVPSVAGSAGEGTPVPEGSISLEEFLQFSSLLTGVEDLDPALGRIYLEALQAGGGQDGPSLAEVYAAASSGSGPAPGDLEALSGTGFFEQEGLGSTADQIITMWYTGVYMLDDEEHVATFVDALAWKVLHFTKPPTICGQFGFWASEPRVDLSPTIQFTPVPAQPGEEE